MMTNSEMRKIINEFSETKNLDVPDHLLLKVIEYIDLKKNFDKNSKYEPILKLDPYFSVEFIPTLKQQQKIEHEELLQYLKMFDSDLFIQDASFENYYLNTNERVKAFEEAKLFLDSNFKDNGSKGLFLLGEYKIGKTYLLSAIAHELAKMKYKVLFVFMPELVRKMKEAISDNTLDEKTNALKRADVLILDDLGGENISSWFRDEILMPTLQYRLNSKLPVFVSSNLDTKALYKHYYSPDGDDVKAGRIIQRLMDLTKLINFS